MTRLLRGLGYAVVGYAVAAPLGYLLVSQVSSNAHDAGLEAAMTAAFVIGPLGGVIGFVTGLLRRRATP